MGCDIHMYVEKKNGEGVYEYIKSVKPFNYRCYGMFAFLAGVRNYSAIKPIAEPRGLPNYLSKEVREIFKENDDYHSCSWLSVKELSEFDYDQLMEDRRENKPIATNIFTGAHTVKVGEGKEMTYCEFLRESFFEDLEVLELIGADRIVFGFDN